MIYGIRRFVVSLVTMPFALGLYGLVYFGLALLADSYASIGIFLANCWALGFAWVVALTFAPILLRIVDKATK